MERTYIEMNRTRLDTGDRFTPKVEEDKDREQVYTISDRVVVAITRSLLTEAERSYTFDGPKRPKPSGCYASVTSFETWLQYSTCGYSAWMNLNTGICHYQIDGETLGSKDKAMKFPDRIFLITPL